MNFRPSPIHHPSHRRPSRRDVLAGSLATASGLLLPGFTLPAFAAEGALLRRPIPHGNGETLPVVGVGTSQVFDVGTDAGRQRVLTDVLKALVDGGGSLIDTASSYDSSEEVVGTLVAGAGNRKQVFLATKLEERRGPAARAEFMASLKHLRVPQVDLIQMHNVDEDAGNLDFFFGLKKEGLTRYVGTTTTDSDDYDAMEAMIKRDKPDFIEIDCSIANRQAEERVIPAAAAVGAAVLIALPYGRAKLFGKVKGKPLPPVAAEIGATTWGEVFLKYLLGNPAITAVIPATANPAHMAENLAAGRGPMPDAKQRQALVASFERLG